MPRIRRATRRNRAATAPHTPSHTTSFRPPVYSDLLWKHRDSHTSLLSNCHIVPHLPREWAIQAWATSRLFYHWPEPLWATSWLLYHLTKLLWATSWLLYHLHELLWATSWLLYHLTTLPLDWAIVSYLLITLPLDYAIQLFVTTEVSN